MTAKTVKERATFVITNGDTSVSFKADGSTVGAVVMAFSLLTPERRLKLLEKLQTKQSELLARESAS
jgi:hypothetical protein